jgi:putative transposase
MGKKGDCWDNAVAESFFGSLEQERVNGKITKHALKRSRTS